MKYIVMDIETTGLIENDEPPDILCVVCKTVFETRTDTGELKYTLGERRTWPTYARLQASEVMSSNDIVQVIMYLRNRPEARVVAWNGVGYDLRVLWMHCDRMKLAIGETAARYIQAITLRSYDPMLVFTFRRGYPIKLSSVAATLPEPMSKTGDGADCKQLWLEGDEADRKNVLMYCENDVDMTCAVFMHIRRTGHIAWITRRGTIAVWQPQDPRDIFAPCNAVIKWSFACNDFMRKREDGTIDHEKQIPTAEQFIGWLQN